MTTIFVELLPCPFCNGAACQSGPLRLVSCSDLECPAFLLAVGALDWNRRALLADQPQAGAGQSAPYEREAFEREFCVSGKSIYWSSKHEAYRSLNGGRALEIDDAEEATVQWCGFQAGAAWQRTQPAARHDQDDEVLRDAKRYRHYRLGFVDPEKFDDEVDAALTHSQQGEEE